MNRAVSAVLWRMNTLFDGIPPTGIQTAMKASWYPHLYTEYFINDTLKDTFLFP